ncbi:MAG: TIGR00159 family protein [Chloroflexi bacterium]|nr:MAG: TIGR00159 family protein [Chloroflexota bacterium]
MLTLRSLVDLTIFRLTNLNWFEILDLVLVVGVFFVLLRLMQRSRAALLLRGVIVLSLVLFVGTLVLPLPAFNWLVRGALITVLIATPIIFQPELRRLLERIGRNTGAAWQVRQTTVEEIVPRLVRAVESMSNNKIGALIALEGNMSLQDIAETGVTIRGQVSSELLQTIFYPGSPLHDGAVVIRADTIVAAGCVLPLTQRPLYARRRLGTRHRAAVGLSEHADALVIVVSEETGDISVARQGSLLRPLDTATLRRNLYQFFIPITPTEPFSMRRLFRRLLKRLWKRPSVPTMRQMVSELGVLGLSVVLAVGTWTFIIQATDPVVQLRLENIPVSVTDMPPNTILMNNPPASISALVQTTESVRQTLGSRSFQAVVSLEGLEPGEHSIPVKIQPELRQVQVLSRDPQVIDLELASVVTRTVEVQVELLGKDSLSRAYQLLGTPIVRPQTVVIEGPAPQVEKVAQVKTSLSVANASTSLRENRPLQVLDANGRSVSGVTVKPDSVEVSVTIQRRFNARDVGVRVVTSGSPPSGYWLSRLTVTPASVTLQGNPDQLNEIGSFVNTLPVELGAVAGKTTVQVPLDLPSGIQAVDSEGKPANTVTVELEISARQSYLSVSRPVKVIGADGALDVQVSPPVVDLILTGPQPALVQIQSDPNLVQALVSITGLETGDNLVAPTIIAPDEVQTQVIPPQVTVKLPESNGKPSQIAPR